MFYLCDLVSGAEYVFDSKRDVLSYWRWNIQGAHTLATCTTKFDFSELNVTGKDCVYGVIKRIPLSYPGFYWVAEYAWRLKKYRVLDEYRRGCDIRDWKREISEVLKEDGPSWWKPVKPAHSPRYRVDPAGIGHKRTNPNHQYPAFTRQRLEAYKNNFELDFEDDLLGFTPMTDHSKPRKLDWTFKKYKTSDTRSWKRTSKNRSQWGRHMERSPEVSLKREVAKEMVEEELEIATSGDEILDQMEYADFCDPDDYEEYDQEDHGYEGFWDYEDLWT